MDIHVGPAVLIGLERGLLSAVERESALRHLAACPLCATRREEIRAELAALESSEPVPGAVGRHIPPGLRAGFAAAPAAIGSELAARIGGHLDRCPRCREAAARAARPRLERRGTVRRPIPLSTFLRFRRGLSVADETPRPRLVRRNWWPALAGLALALVIAAVLVPRWLAELEGARAITVATPLRLLGDGGAITPPAAVHLEPGTPLVLFIKLPVPPPAAARFELVMRRQGARDLKRRVSGAAFDPSGTVAILIAPAALHPGERVEVDLVAIGDASGAAVFSDAFTVGDPGSGDRP